MRDPVHTLVLLRHGQSVWNQENRFTGWTDVDLSPQGVEEARRAARLMQAAGLDFDLAFSSVLKRAIRTVWIVQDALDRMWVPSTLAWQLNERHYGALQGLDKASIAERFGAEQVQRWRRSYEERPPALDPSDPRSALHDPRYRRLDSDKIPSRESLADCTARLLPYWTGAVESAIAAGSRLLVVGHGNSLRAIVRHLDRLSEEAVADLEIPTGVPLVYTLDAALSPVHRVYLGDESHPAPGVSHLVSEATGTG